MNLSQSVSQEIPRWSYISCKSNEGQIELALKPLKLVGESRI